MLPADLVLVQDLRVVAQVAVQPRPPQPLHPAGRVAGGHEHRPHHALQHVQRGQARLWGGGAHEGLLEVLALELETKVHPKVRNNGEGPY